MKKEQELSFEEAIFDQWSGDLKRLELPLGRGVFWLLGGLGLILIFIVLGRVFYLTIVSGDFYQNRAALNINKELVVPAYRGIITDRFGEQLVKNIPGFRVSIDKNELLRLKENRDEFLTKVAKILGKEKGELETVIEKIDLEQGTKAIVSRDITLEQAIDLRALQSEAVLVEDDFKREYIEPLVFSHILGFTGIVDWTNTIEGKTGVETVYDQQLRGTDGVKIFYRDVGGNTLQEKITSEAKPGFPLQLTIDGDFQRYFYQRFRQGLAQLDRSSGAGIAFNPKTGEILALVSFPSYSNNEPAKYLAGWQNPMFNRAVSGLYAPGSAVKPLVALAALREKVVKPSDSFAAPGVLEIPNPYNPERPSRFLDWRDHGIVDLYEALARSSNIYFYIVGGGIPAGTSGYKPFKGLGIERLRRYWSQFGFDAITGVDLPGEAVGFLAGPEEKQLRLDQPWRIGDTYNVAIGQGDLTVTPLRLLTMVSAFANNGVMMKPHISQSAYPEVLRDFSDWTAEIKEVKKGLRDAVAQSYGTANRLYDLSYKTAGKTGSAQIANNTKTNAFFVGYGPDSDPEIALLVLVEDALGGSLNAVPIARDVFEWYYNNRL